MKLIRFGDPGREEPGVLLPDGRRGDASGESTGSDEGFVACGGFESLREWVVDGCPDGTEVDPLVRLGSPVDGSSRVVCIGGNSVNGASLVVRPWS